MTSVRPRRDPLSVDSAFAPILASAQRGTGTSFEELYRWLAPAVAGYFRAQGERDAEDLTSEVFLGVFRNLASFSGSRAEFRTWVFSVAHRRLIDQRRRTSRRPVTVVADCGRPDRADTDVAEQALARLSSERVVRPTRPPNSRAASTATIAKVIMVERPTLANGAENSGTAAAINTVHGAPSMRRNAAT